MLEKLKEEVCACNLRLPKEHLVIVTNGNVSGIDESRTYMVIKPSGVSYDTLSPEMMVILDMEGNRVEGDLKPSVDWPHHLFIYKHMPEIGGVVHTHSPYVTAHAMVGESINCCTTAQADTFGPVIPVSQYASNRGDEIGKEIIRCSVEGCLAVILKHHGAFIFDKSPYEALNMAVMLEHVCQVNYLGQSLGVALGKEPQTMPLEEVRVWYARHHGGGYGQDV